MIHRREADDDDKSRGGSSHGVAPMDSLSERCPDRLGYERGHPVVGSSGNGGRPAVVRRQQVALDGGGQMQALQFRRKGRGEVCPHYRPDQSYP